MGRIVYETATSFDGFIADEWNSLSWLFAVPGGDNPVLMPPQAAIQVMGSTTYEWVLAELDGLNEPDAWKSAFSECQVIVFTTQQRDIPDEADVEFYSGDVADALPSIRHAAGDGDIWVVGGGHLAAQFIEAEALDELVFTMAPVALGQGAPLLPLRIDSDRLTLSSARQVGQFARLTYDISYPDQH